MQVRSLARRGRIVLAVSVVALFVLVVSLPAPFASAEQEGARETILFIRHGEKSPDGYGQLSCKGLNRALALAGRLVQRYGRIDAVFAPDPSQQKRDGALSYDYVRPLATVEPTAIRFGLPVHAAIGYADTDKLLAALLAPFYRKATVLVAWEHHQLNTMVPQLVGSLGGDAHAVPDWTGDDYDSIWQVTVSRDAQDKPTVAFASLRQNLDGQPVGCPQ